MRAVAIIPARGGSKRIPKKNIKPFAGQPIIAYSIKAAQETRLFERIVVSTDSEEIAEVGKFYGAEVPFIRPDELADDHTGTAEVISHAVNWMWEQRWKINSICCIYATAPFIQPDDLVESYSIFESGDWDFVFAATEYVYPIQRSFKIQQNGSVGMFFPEHFVSRSQDLAKAYHDAGQFCWGKPEAWVGNRMVFSEKSTVLRIPGYRVQDIDTKEDWLRAQIIFEMLQKKGYIQISQPTKIFA